LPRNAEEALRAMQIEAAEDEPKHVFSCSADPGCSCNGQIEKLTKRAWLEQHLQ
jgi:hypothetical protein